MILSHWPLVAFSILVIALTPGPSMLLGFGLAAQYGARRSLTAGFGLLSALMAYAALSLAGLGALLLAVPELITALQWFGVAFLLWMGLNALLGARAHTKAPPDSATNAPALRRLYRRGLLTAIGNPKAMVFFTAVFPQFIDPAQPVAAQIAVLCATFAAAWSLAFVAYAAAGALLRRRAQARTGKPLLQWISGGVYLSAAGLLAISR